MEPSNVYNPYASLASQAPAEARASFIRKTYLTLGGALLVFAGLCALSVNSPFAPLFVNWIGTMPYGWLLVMGAFMAVGWVADRWATSDASSGLQFAGMGLYLIAQAVIFTPLLYLAAFYSSPDVIPSAGLLTAFLFGGITMTAFLTQKDFSFLGGIITVASWVALGVIVVSILFGFNLGVFFAGVMVLLAGGSILYTTSNIIHNYRTDQHVAAALALFAGVALMFYYILYIFLASRR